MILGFTGLAFIPLAWPPAGYDHSIPDPFQKLLENPDASLIYLVMVTAFNPETNSQQSYYFSDHGYITTPSDSLPNQPFRPLLDNPFSFEVSLFQGVDPFNIALPGFGDISIFNGSDGDYDGWSDLSFFGRDIKILAGDKGFPYIDFTTIFSGIAGGLRWGEDTISIAVRPKSDILDRPIVRNLYAGTGGKEGGSDLAGKSKPLAYGICRQIEPVNIDWANQVWQVHDGTIQAVDAVRDQGLSLNKGSNYSSYATMMAASVASSSYVTCHAEGLFRLGSQPAGRITADVRGDATGSYISTASDILMRIVKTRLGNFCLTDQDIDLSSFAAVSQARSWSVGFYVADDIQAADAALQLARSVGGYVSFTRSGLLTMGILEKASTVNITIDEDIIDQSGIECTGTLAPAWRIRVGYRKLGVVLSDSDVAGDVSSTDRAYFREEYRFATASNASILSDYKDARDVEFLTLLDTQSDAEALASSLLALLGSSMRRYRVPIRDFPFRYTLGNTVKLQIQRFGLSDGKPFIIVGLNESARDNDNSLELWG